ncbi:hypothetical protein CLOM_g24200 [Closterium sp. NIES-68]|nr:hypothetical protein CLOM_g24200 [Closterium sp. NIES-68]
MHLLPETDCGPKAWAVLKDLHAPTSVAASLMLDRELSMLRLSENEPVQPRGRGGAGARGRGGHSNNDNSEPRLKGECCGTAVARAGEELHPLDMWVMDSGAAWTMTPRKDLLDAVQAPPISEVRSASGHAVKASRACGYAVAAATA